MAISTNVLEIPFAKQDGALAFDRYQRERYFPMLDGIRALSIFAVITTHASSHLEWLHGSQGVNAFFVLSGFLITTLLLREERDAGQVSLAGFYIRRSFRILPLYYLTLGLYCVLLLGIKVQPERAEFFRHALPYYALYFPEYIHLNGGGPFSHSWSLGIEEKFYALWPVLGFVLLRGRAGARPVVLLGLIACILMLPRSVEWTKYVRPYVPIAVGCFSAFLLHRRDYYDKLRPLASRPGLFLALAFGVILVDGHPSSAFVAVACAIALISLVLAAPAGTPVTRFMASRPVRFVGQRAYEIYLLHQAVLNVIRPRLMAIDEPVRGLLLTVLGFAATVLVASIAHRVVGQPLTQWGRRIAGRGVRVQYAAPPVGIA
jgi:peptidoglycan/LPS O-acetylase OafA/YrhL